MKQRKQWLRMIAVLICVGMIAGCGEKPKTEVVPTPTVVATEAPTETIAPTTEPTATAVPTVEPTATNTPVPTATNTPVPTATNIPAPTVTPTVRPVNAEGPISGASAFEITSSMIVGWNLGNTLDSTGSHITYDTAPGKAVMAWGNDEPTKELFEAVKAGGFNTVRIPTTWYQHVKYDDVKDMYVINPDWLAYVKKTVDYAYDLNLFVILNCHHEDWANAPKFDDAAYEKASKMLTDIWSQVATIFADYDQHLIFEGMNEPRQTGLGSSVEWGGGDTNSWKYINKLNQVFVNTVRGQGSTANAERLLMLPGYCASSNIATIKAIDVPENSGNIALSVHAYYPYFFAMATDKYANHSFPGKSGYGENYESSIKTLFRDLKKVSADKKVPIIIGEFGASDFNNREDRARWATCFLGCAKDAGIPCVFWDNNASYNGTGEAYGLIYRKTLTWYENSIPMLNAVMEVYGQESSLPSYTEYVQPDFDWANIPVEKDWVEIYRADAGYAIDTWGNLCLENWQSYLNEDYDIVMVYQSDAEPYMVLQGGWHKVFTSEVNDNPYMIRFTFADVEKTMKVENVKLSDMYNYFASASSKPMTLYGVYAVPKNVGDKSEEKAVRIDNVEDFLEAIEPGTDIIFLPGYYNLSEYTDDIWKTEGEEWNRTHPYVQLRECFDGGIEVVVQNVDDITISGDLKSAITTELVVETRYGAVLNFESCSNIVLTGLTMGHTEAGICEESVIAFSDCKEIYLSEMDLYGCGMYGFYAKNGSGNIYVHNSVIRECEGGPFYVTEPEGKYEFRFCQLKESRSGGYFESSKEAKLSFTECYFGTHETNYWFFNEEAVFTDCFWEEITMYPDIEPEGEY